jgi:hypothetical protein
VALLWIVIQLGFFQSSASWDVLAAAWRYRISAEVSLRASASGQSAGSYLVLGLMGSAALTISSALVSQDVFADTDHRHQS